MLSEKRKLSIRRYMKSEKGRAAIKAGDLRRKLENPEKYHAQKRAYRMKYHQLNPEKRILSSAKTRAKRDNLPFTITLQDIKIPENCPVLGIPLYIGGVENRDHSPSLDRIIPVLGYIPENIMVISFRANRLKNNGTPEELHRVAEFYRNLHYPPSLSPTDAL